MSSKTKDNLIYILILAIIFLIGINFKKQRESSSPEHLVDTSDLSVSQSEINGTVPRSNESYNSNQYDNTRLKAQKDNKFMNKSNINDPGELMKKKFSAMAKLKAEFPDDLEYLYFDDIAEDTVLLEGYLNSENVYTATVATKGIFPENDVLDLIKKNPDLLPGLEDDLSWINTDTSSVKLKGLQQGVRDAYYWNLKKQGGDSISIVYGVRSDSRGSYFLLVHGPEQYIQQNEGKFENYLSSFKPIK